MSTKQTITHIGSTNSNQWTWKQVVTEIWNDDYITTNQSQINVKTYLGRASSNSYFGGVASVSITCNGETRNSSKTFTYPTYVNAGQWVLAQESNFTVEHNADGTKSISVSSSMSTSDFTPSSASASGSMTLSTIPRATACPNISGYIEEGATIILNPASSSFKHKIWFDYNGKKVFYPSRYEYFKDKGVIPLDTSYYALTPGQVGTCQIELYTFDENGNDIGMKTATLTIRCDYNRCYPNIEYTMKDVNETTVNLTGNNQKLIKGYSDLHVGYTITPKNGATITKKNFNDLNLINNEYNPFIYFKVNTNNFTLSCEDSRGFSNHLSKEMEMINYIPLSLNFNAFRTTPTGNEIKLEFEGNWFPGNFGATYNNIEIIVKYRELPSGEIRTAKWLSYNTDYSYNGNTGKIQSGTGSSPSAINIPKEFPYNKSYEIILEYYDKLTHTTSAKQVPKGEPVLNWKDDLVNVNGRFTINNIETKLTTSKNKLNYYKIVQDNNGISINGNQLTYYTINPKGCDMLFNWKPNTPYAIKLVTSNKNSGTNNHLQFVVEYTDGTRDTTDSSGDITNTSKYTFKIISNPNKTIKEIHSAYTWNSPAILYLDESMINEGDKYLPYEPYSPMKEIQIVNKYGAEPFLGMESGYNENGSWIKFSDGTMIQYMRLSIEGGIGSKTFTLPLPFANKMFSVAFTNIYANAKNITAAITTPSNSQFTMYPFKTNTDQTPPESSQFTAIVVGRWK